MSCVQFSEAVQLSLLAFITKMKPALSSNWKKSAETCLVCGLFYCAKNKMGEEQRDKIHFIEFYFL